MVKKKGLLSSLVLMTALAVAVFFILYCLVPEVSEHLFGTSIKDGEIKQVTDQALEIFISSNTGTDEEEVKRFLSSDQVRIALASAKELTGETAAALARSSGELLAELKKYDISLSDLESVMDTAEVTKALSSLASGDTDSADEIVSLVRKAVGK